MNQIYNMIKYSFQVPKSNIFFLQYYSIIYFVIIYFLNYVKTATCINHYPTVGYIINHSFLLLLLVPTL